VDSVLCEAVGRKDNEDGFRSAARRGKERKALREAITSM
jgi:hypothetical protein